MNAPRTSFLSQLRELDRRRHAWPGEHWFALAAGLYFLQRSSPTRLGRLASAATGVALVARALSGRDGAIAVLRRPERPRAEGLVDVAAPWPYEDRTRIASGKVEA
jgi:hypothetical protein